MNETNQPGYGFQTTHWSLVIKAAGSDSIDAKEALELLCRSYWRPIFHYIRARGFQGGEAQDLTQDFFYIVIEKDYFGQADQERGRFRAFLKTAIKNFLSNQWKKANRQKRGGDFDFCSFDQFEEERFETGYSKADTPDIAYDRQWARSTFETTLDTVREEMEERGQMDRFNLFNPFLMPKAAGKSYAEAAASANISEQAFKSGLHRFRESIRSCFLQEVAKTVSDPSDVENEARELMKAIAGA